MQMLLKRCSATIYLASVVVFLNSFSHQRKFAGPTAVSRLDVLHALYSHYTVTINDYHTNTSEKALFMGCYYSDKAPGAAALALPCVFAAASVLKHAGISIQSHTRWLWTSGISFGLTAGILTALGAAAAFHWLQRYVPARVALLTSVAMFLGGMPLPYATFMYSHAQVVGLLTISMWALDRRACEDGHRQAGKSRMDLLAGFAAGTALASEYTAGIVVVLIVLWLGSVTLRRAPVFCLSSIPPLSLIPIYSLLTLGTPLELPYSYQASFVAMKEGLYAIKWPNAETAYELLFGSSRGLFFWNPFCLLSCVGFARLVNTSIRLFWLTYACFLLQVPVISGRVWDWNAGPCFGPRCLAPVIALLVVPCALGAERLRRTGVVLAAYSISVTTLATLSNSSFSETWRTPFSRSLFLWLKGQISIRTSECCLGCPRLLRLRFITPSV